MTPQTSASSDRCAIDAKKVEGLSSVFAHQGWVRVERLLTPSLLANVTDWIAATELREYVHTEIASNSEFMADNGKAVVGLRWLLNDRELFQQVETITGCTRIGSFAGRLYQFAPGMGHHDAWHNDVDGNRLVALSINVGEEPHQGGALQIREAASTRVVARVVNTTPGDAILFSLDPRYEHRVSEVTGSSPRTVFAGWFTSDPDFDQYLNEETS